MRERGKAMGSEFVGKGVNIALGPDVNMLRVPQGTVIKDEKPWTVLISISRKLVGTGKASVLIPSSPVKQPTRPSSECSNLGSKPAPNTGSTTSRNTPGQNLHLKSMIGPSMRYTLTHFCDP